MVHPDVTVSSVAPLQSLSTPSQTSAEGTRASQTTCPLMSHTVMPWHVPNPLVISHSVDGPLSVTPSQSLSTPSQASGLGTGASQSLMPWPVQVRSPRHVPTSSTVRLHVVDAPDATAPDEQVHSPGAPSANGAGMHCWLDVPSTSSATAHTQPSGQALPAHAAPQNAPRVASPAGMQVCPSSGASRQSALVSHG